MSKRYNKSRERFLTIIILLISGLGFVAGIFHNTAETEANALYEEATGHELTAESMSLFVQSLYETDVESFERAEAAFIEALELMYVWQAILDLNLPTDMEKLQNATLMMQILGKFWQVWNLQADTTVSRLWENFNRTRGGERILATQLTHRFDYVITFDLWKSFNDTYPNLIVIPAVTFLNESLEHVPEFYNKITDELQVHYYCEFNRDSYQDMLNIPLFEAKDLAFQTLENANLHAGAADTLSIMVSFTTVAVVLSSAMSERIDKKRLERYISRVRADIQKDESLLSVGRDRLASIGLILALILALAGFLMTTPAWFHIF